MALAIVLFVPNGIVMASDGLSEIRNQSNDHEYLQLKQKTLFQSSLGYLICCPCPIYVNGLPLAYYFELQIAKISESSSTSDFANQLVQKLISSGVPKDNIIFYVSGYFNHEQEVFLVDRGNFSKVNESADSGPVYNYHSIGHSVWVDKLLLPTSSDIGNGKTIDFMPADIDFSKYSVQEAVDFAVFLLKISRQMDCFAQMNQNVGGFLSIGTHELSGLIKLFSINS